MSLEVIVIILMGIGLLSILDCALNMRSELKKEEKSARSIRLKARYLLAKDRQLFSDFERMADDLGVYSGKYLTNFPDFATWKTLNGEDLRDVTSIPRKRTKY